MLTDLLGWWRQFPDKNPKYVIGLEERQQEAETQAKYNTSDKDILPV